MSPESETKFVTGPVADRIFVVVVLGSLSAWVIWGWRSWMKRPQQLSGLVISSLVGFSFASVSAALEVASGTYAQFREGGFPFNDPMLLRIYFLGFLFALLGLI